MSNKVLLLIAALLVILAGAVFSIGTHLQTSPVTPPSQTNDQTPSAQLANPASVNCTQALGGTLEITDTAQGQIGYCHLPDGRVCEEWALFRDGSCVAPGS